MRQLIRYAKSGEYRVIDTDNMTASECLYYDERDEPLDQYELDDDLAESDLDTDYIVIREEAA